MSPRHPTCIAAFLFNVCLRRQQDAFACAARAAKRMLSGRQQPSTLRPRRDTRSLSPPVWCYDLTEDRCSGYYAGHPSHECGWDAKQQQCSSNRRVSTWCGASASRQAMQCQYMRTLASKDQAGRCRMDGDHLDGKWVQTCQPSLITQPDVYAYERPIARLPGKYDYRLCFRQSPRELARTQAALSWSWQPRACHLAPVEGQQFDSWLGRRTVLLLGDSIMGQLLYSLVFLLGRAVAHIRHFSSSRGDLRQAAANASAQNVCESSAGSEGDGQAVEVTLQHGGRVLFFMSHFALVQQMQHADRAPWSEYAREADFVLLNLGHHFRQIDPTFASYSSVVRATELSLSSVLKPQAHLAFLTTNIGHPNCGAATRPFDSPSTAWDQLVSSGSPYDWRPPDGLASAANLTGQRIRFYSTATGDTPDRFDWRAPPLHEDAWRHVFTRSTAFAHRFHVLNVSFVDARPDGHVAAASSKPGAAASPDCLHYCYPGVSDFWAASLYNLLLAL